MGSTVLGLTLETDHKLEASLESYKRAVLEDTVSKGEAQTGLPSLSQGKAKKNHRRDITRGDGAAIPHL